MPLRWGLLGTARINRHLIPAIRSSPRSILHCVASREASRVAAYAAEWDIPHGWASYEALLDSDVDIVYISLPNSLHVPWTLRALQAGKHVLCEKPLALTAAAVDDLAAAARASGRIVTEGLMYRHAAQTLRIAEMVAAGDIGEVRTIAGGYSHPQSRGDSDPRVNPLLGGGALWDVGCYPVSFAHLVSGALPVAVSGARTLGPGGVDHAFAATIRYANGVTAQCFAGFRMAYQTFMRIVGDTGVVDIPHPFRPAPFDSFTVLRDQVCERIDIRGSAVFEDEVADMEDAVLGIKPPRVSLVESRQLAHTLEVLHHSADRDGSLLSLSRPPGLAESP